MSNQMKVTLDGGPRISASYDGFEIVTDQSPDSGGGGTAPEPYDLFLASLATCAGYYVYKFCSARDLPTHGISLTQSWERGGDGKIATIRLAIDLPDGFPDKYRAAVARAAAQCTVKKTIERAPEMVIDVSGS